MIKENDAQKNSSKIEKVKKQSEYIEILAYKNALSFRLSLLLTKNNFR
jgi:hypothetical protein